MENISDYLDDNSIKQITSVYADKGYDSKAIREYLKSRNILIVFTRNFKTKNNKTTNQNDYSKTRYVVERFFAWLKCGFHRMAIRYSENYFGLVNIASIMMYGEFWDKLDVLESFGINYLS